MTAQEAINKIKAEKTVFMGHEVNKYNYAVEIREQLENMTRTGVLSPKEYYVALEITYKDMSSAEKSFEFEILNN